MTESKIIRFGPGYDKWDLSKSDQENWDKMKEYYKKEKGVDIGEIPFLTKDEDARLTELLKNIN